MPLLNFPSYVAAPHPSQLITFYKLVLVNLRKILLRGDSPFDKSVAKHRKPYKTLRFARGDILRADRKNALAQGKREGFVRIPFDRRGMDT